MPTITGCDRIARGEFDAELDGKRVALLAHAASVDRNLVPTLEVLRARGAEVVKLLTPEHGYFGVAQDMIPVSSEPIEMLEVISLYGSTAADLVPKKSVFDGVDLVICDLQDVGVRYYTYVWTTAFVLREAVRREKDIWILDRPNPLGGERVEGAPQRGGYLSFVGLYAVAVRHGMTCGELMHLAAEREQIARTKYRVIEMEGWLRSMGFEDTHLPWVMPSPNMPTPDTARVYAGGCLIEGTTLSEGRGTTRPFEIWGAPWLDPTKLSSVEHASLRTLRFLPTFQKHADSLCEGVQVHAESGAFESYYAYANWIAEAIAQIPDDIFPWRREAYEYETERPAIDLLTGGPEFRQTANRHERLDSWLSRERAGAARFIEAREPFLLY